MAVDPTAAHQSLWKWCRAHDFAGYDPFDALNSRLFQRTPFKHSRVARIAWTQFSKRSPVNLRSLTVIPAGKNPKGIALFALAALADFRRLRTKETEAAARELLNDLLRARLESKSGAACWGYNFDWQGRAFFAPRGTPTIVPTAFATRALVEAARALGDESYLETARSTCDFILQDLNRSDESEDTVCFSYSPLDRTCVFNASLLAAETLAAVGSMTGETGLCDWAIRAARYVVRRQNSDGSWAYGKDSYQSWSDNFHTAFVLTSLSRIIQALAELRAESAEDRPRENLTNGVSAEFAGAVRRGYDFWRARFFLANGWPKYYPDRLYPADAHAAGAAIIALADLQWLDPGAWDFAGQIAEWTIENLRDRRGYFYYQRRRFHTVRTPYMRWSEAWMLYALSRLLEGPRK
ncbi:MAG: delta-aminolevulinic acid dehydratase [Pyrinomonadaceae bacterium]